MSEKVHSAKASMKSLDLSKAGDSAIVVDAFNGEGKIGKLYVGQGGVAWKVGKGKKRRYSWTELAKIL